MKMSSIGRFLLDDPSQAWIIRQGSVDLFLIDKVGTQLDSSLDYIGTLEAGSPLLGVGALRNDGRETTVIAQSAPSTVLEWCTLDSKRGGTVDLRAIDAIELDQWIEVFSQFCAPGLAPPASKQVEAGESGETGDIPVTLIGNRSVTWIEGAQTPLDIYDSNLPVQTKWIGAVPVCRYLWAIVQPREALYCSTTSDWFARAQVTGDAAPAMEYFHEALLTQRAERRRQLTEQESGRFHEKIQRDGAAFGQALRDLISPLSPVDASEFGSLEDCGSVTADALEACRAVGQVLGIEVMAPETEVAGETAARSVIRIASASGVRHRQVLLRDWWWKRDQGPMVGFTQNGASAVALLPVGGSNYVMLEAGSKKRVAVTEQISATLDPHAFTLYRPFPNQALSILDILRFGLRNRTKDVATILGVSVAAGLLGLAMPIATGILFDEIIPAGQRDGLVQLSIMLISASFATFLMRLGQSFAMQRLEGRMEADTQAAVWDRLLNLRVGFFREYTTGDLASRALAINQIRQALTGNAMTTLLTGIFSVFSFALLFSYSVKLALLATELAAVAITLSVISTVLSVRIQRRTMALGGKIAGRVAELLQGVAKFRVAGAEPRAFARWAEDYAWQKRESLKNSKISIAMGIFNTVFPAATSILIYIVAASMIRNGPKFTTGSFLAFNAAFGQFLGSTLGFASAVLSLVVVVPTYERARPILQELPEQKIDLRSPGELGGAIEVSHVSFRYKPDSPLVLNDLSFSIKAGQYVAMVGESGCGKSTIMRLLLGFESPESGSVSYDGGDLAELNKQAVRRQIGVVLQSGKLMAADLYTNIVGGSLLSIDDAWEAAKRVGLDEDIRAMPMGMHTLISESGGGLSGGQKQRIMIARAIVHHPRILFFDEATSALDNQTQAIVSQSLESMQATRIVIAHRLSTIIHADLILVFKAGHLHDSGSYSELMAKQGYFAELAKRQLT